MTIEEIIQRLYYHYFENMGIAPKIMIIGRKFYGQLLQEVWRAGGKLDGALLSFYYNMKIILWESDVLEVCTNDIAIQYLSPNPINCKNVYI